MIATDSGNINTMEFIDIRIKEKRIGKDNYLGDVPPINFLDPINFTPRTPHKEPPPSRGDREAVQRTQRWIFATISRETTRIEQETTDRLVSSVDTCIFFNSKNEFHNS
jgi:hypothetical protein